MNAKTKDRLTQFYETYLVENEDLFAQDAFAKNMYRALLSGDKEVYQKNIEETRIFDEEWIVTLESYFSSIDFITRNPKSAIKYEQEVVAIEKARKINSHSVKHLSANTHLIKEATEDNVRPKSILTTYTEIDYATYENRMVYTLINRLYYFVRARHEAIKANIDSFQNKTLYFKAEFPFNKVDLTFDLKLNVKEELDNKEINKYNQQLLKRVEKLQKFVMGFQNTPFMDGLKKTQPVKTPIMKTNIFLKNVHYKNCYMLWLFLDRYNTLAFETEIKEKTLPLNKEYEKSVYQDVVVGLASVLYYYEERKIEFNTFDKVKRRKSLQVIKDLDLDPLFDEELEIEDQNINQYYLEQNRKLFEQALEYHEENSSTYEVALKRALRETVEFSNALYKEFFEFEKEEDIFRRLITSKDPKVELEEVRQMVLISRVIREVKEVDYRRIIQFERNLLNKTAELDQVLINSAQKGLEAAVQMEKNELVLKHEKSKSILENQNLKLEFDETKAIASELDEYRKNIFNTFKAIEKEYKQKEIDEIKELRQTLKVEHAAIINAEKERHQGVMKELETNRRNEINQIDNEFRRNKNEVIEAYQEILAKENILLTEAFQEELDALRIELDQLMALAEQEASMSVAEARDSKNQRYARLVKDVEEYKDLKFKIARLQAQREKKGTPSNKKRVYYRK